MLKAFGLHSDDLGRQSDCIFGFWVSGFDMMTKLSFVSDIDEYDIFQHQPLFCLHTLSGL